MPSRIDCVFTAGDLVIGGESKRAQDLVDSTRSRRLARQMRVLIDNVDIPALLLRSYLPDFNSLDNLDVMFNLLCLQQLGVRILPLPYESHAALTYLLRYREALVNDSRTPLSAIRGSDERKVEGGSLLRKIKGIGPTMEAKLREEFGSTLAVLKASEEELRKAGMSVKVVERMKEMVK